MSMTQEAPSDTQDPFNHGETVYIGPFTVESYSESEGWWGLHIDGAIDRWEERHRIVAGNRVLSDEDLAALRQVWDFADECEKLVLIEWSTDIRAALIRLNALIGATP